MKKLIFNSILLTYLLVTNSCGQKPSELPEGFDHIETSTLVFLSTQLIELCTDTIQVRAFVGRVSSLKISTRNLSENDRRENLVILKMLYDSISNRKVKQNTSLEQSKRTLLNILEPYGKLPFTVDFDLVSSQLDNSKRSLSKGYDEGSVSESRFIFFLRDPFLVKQVYVKQGQEEKWKRSGIFLCKYIRDNDNPIWLRETLHSQIISWLNTLPTSADIVKIQSDLSKCKYQDDLYD